MNVGMAVPGFYVLNLREERYLHLGKNKTDIGDRRPDGNVRPAGFRVFKSDPVFNIRSNLDPVFKIRSNLDPVSKVWTDPVFKIW